MDTRLRGIAAKYQWGCQPLPENTILAIDENEFLVVIGPRIIIFDEESAKNGTQILTNPDVS